MADMITRLDDLQLPLETLQKLEKDGIRIIRPLAPDMQAILDFVREHFDPGWAGECACALARVPASCVVAVKEKEIIGFACYDVTAKGYFGPIGVHPQKRVGGVGSALLLQCLYAMKCDGYGYAIIGGGSGVAGFYEKECGATIIPGSDPGIYRNRIGYCPQEHGV